MSEDTPPKDNKLINQSLTVSCDDCEAGENEYCHSNAVWVHASRMFKSGALSE